METLKDFDIQFTGLKQGEHKFGYDIEKSFFDHFGFDEFNGAEIKAQANLTKKSTLLEFEFYANGSVNVNCDLTNEAYDQPIMNSMSLIVKFGETYNDENEEILILPHGEHTINVAQFLYELIVLSTPTKRIHPGVKDGSLKTEMLSRLEDLSPKGLKNENEKTDPRWDNLKKLLTDK